MLETVIIVVLIFAALGGWLFWDHSRNSQKIKSPVETEGKVIEFASHTKVKSGAIQTITTDDDDNVLFYPVVRFVLEGAKGVKFRDKKGYKEDDLPFAIGQTVRVVYDKKNPLLAEIKYN